MDYLDAQPPHKQQRGDYRCDVCNTSFNHRRTLLRHQRENSQHLEKMGLLAQERPVCELCYRSFSRPFDLLRHQSQVHGGQKRPVPRALDVDRSTVQEIVAISTLPETGEPSLYRSPIMSPLWATDSKVLWYDHESASDVDLPDPDDDSSSCSPPLLSLGEICESIYEKFHGPSESPYKTIMLLRQRSSFDHWDSVTPASEASDSWVDIYFQDTGDTRHKFWSCELISGVPLPVLALPTVVVLRQEQALSAMQCMFLPGIQIGEAVKRQPLLSLVAGVILNNRFLSRRPGCIHFRYLLEGCGPTKWKRLCLHSQSDQVSDAASEGCEKCLTLGGNGSWRHVLIPSGIEKYINDCAVTAHVSDFAWASGNEFLLHVEMAFFALDENQSA